MQPAILLCALPYRDVNVPTVEHLASWPVQACIHTHTHTHTTIAIIQCYSNTKEFLNNSSEKHWSLYNCTEH